MKSSPTIVPLNWDSIKNTLSDGLIKEFSRELMFLQMNIYNTPDNKKVPINRDEIPILYDFLLKNCRDNVRFTRSKKNGIQQRRCSQCYEYFENDGKQITHEQIHKDENCKWYIWYDIVYCSCDKKLKELGLLDDDKKYDEFADNEPDCTCKKKTFVWICEDCRTEGGC